MFLGKLLHSLTILTAPGRPVLVFCCNCCIAQNVCCDARSGEVDEGDCRHECDDEK